MRPLFYTLNDARRWAAFSGDYNPVHFDKSWVQAQGGEALSVHGMRALLDVKRFISPALNRSPFLKCTVRLRRPLWCDTPYILMRDEKKRATVADSPDGPACLSCQITPEHAFPLAAHVSQRALDSATLGALQQAFAPLLPNAQRWHFLDAVLFRHLIQDDALLRQDSIAGLIPHCRSLESLFACYPVVQTHQEILFSESLLSDWQPDAAPEPLIIDTLPALVIGTLEQGAIVRIAARLRYQQYAISNAVTLKVGPAALQ